MYNLRYILLLTLAAAFGGFLFGYDTAVIAGAIGFLRAHFNLSAGLTGWAASSVLVGCMVGAFLGGPFGDRFGRKPSLLLCALLFALSSVASAVPETLGQFAWARFAGGMAIGAASILSPIYIAEVSPEKIRGRLVALYQLAIVIGILTVYFVNLQIQRLGNESWNVDWGWRWMFASLVIPSALFGLLLAFVPESPRWLMKKGSKQQAWRILVKIGGKRNAETELKSIETALQEEQGTWKEIFSTGYSRALLIGSLLAIFSQFSGINSIMYYAPEIFKAAGSGTDSAFVQTVTVGAVNLLFTLVAVLFVDKAGRKPLLILGTAIQAVSLACVGYFITTPGQGWLLLFSILTFAAAFNMALGPISWIVNSEIFPTKLRGRAMGITTSLLWLACYLVSQTFPMLVDGIGPSWTFWLYALCSLATMVFVIKMVPETKGRTLEQIEANWRR